MAMLHHNGVRYPMPVHSAKSVHISIYHSKPGETGEMYLVYHAS